MSTACISKNSTRSLICRIRRLLSPLATVALAAMTVCSAWAQTTTPAISIGDGSVLETDFDFPTLNIRATRTGDTTANIGLVYRTDDSPTDPAEAGVDYFPLDPDLDFVVGRALLPAGASSVDLPVEVFSDTEIETDEDFLVHLLSAHNAGPTPAFGTAANFGIGNDPRAVVSADFNGDGRLDLAAVTNGNPGSVNVRLNTAAPGAPPAFATAAAFFVGSSPESIAVGDVNGDGRPDLATANSSPGTLSVLINTTAPNANTPIFATHTEFSSGSSNGNTRSAVLADVNGDGRPDLVATNPNNDEVLVRINTTPAGPAGVTTPTFGTVASFQVGLLPRAVVVGDLNGDGRADLAVANRNAETVSVLRNTTAPGALTASFAGQNVFFANISRSLALGDVDGDGRADLVVGDEGSDHFDVLINATAPGATTFSFAGYENFAPGLEFDAVALGDLNGDGRPDVAAVQSSGNTASVFLNITKPGAAPSFSPATTYATGTGPNHLAVADLDGNGRPELLVANSGSDNVSVFRNLTAPAEPAPSFAAQVGFGGSGGDVIAADFNGDGWPDLAVTNSGSANVSVHLNTAAPGAASPSYAPKNDFATGALPLSVTAADFNGDGRPDLAVVNRDSSTVSVLLNLTAPGATAAAFTLATNVGPSSFPFALAVTATDVNGDGRPDLAVTTNGNVSVLLNDTAPGAATPSFPTKTDFALGFTARSIAAADFNGDGRPDLAVDRIGNDRVSVLLNRTPAGDATPDFAPTSDFITDDGPVFVTAADLNGDGRPDLAVSNTLADTVAVLINTAAPGAAAASFAPRTSHAAGTQPGGLSAADLNGDGRLDLAVGHSNFNALTVLRNLTAPGATAASFGRTDFSPFVSDSVATADFNADGRPDVAGGSSVRLNLLYGASIATNEATGTIINDDFPSLSINDLTLAEGNSGTTAFTFTVSLSEAATFIVKVDAASADGSATLAGGDYAALPATTLTFAPGDTSETVTVNVNGDTTFEPGETFAVNLSNPFNASFSFGGNSGVGVINNDDAQPTVSFTAASQSAGEGAGVATATVQLSSASHQTITVPFTVAGSADSGDRSVTPASPLSFAPGQTSKTISVSITDDDEDENDETVVLNLGTPANASLGSPASHTLTIEDNDETPTVSFADGALSVDENAGTVQSRVTLSVAASEDVTLTISVIGGSASNGADYTLPADSLVTIPAGETFADLSISISNDTLDEDNETLGLQIFTPTNATLTAPFTQLITIVDDDATPTVSFDSAGASFDENAGTLMIPVRLSAASGLEVRAAFAVSGSATAGDFSSPTSSPLVFPPGSTAANVVVNIANDTLDENSESVVFTLGALTNAGPGAQQAYTATILDDDDAPTVSFDLAASSVNEDAGTVTLGFSLSAPSSQQVTVPFTATGALGARGATVNTHSPVVIGAGNQTGSITLAIDDDTLDEFDQFVTLTLGTPTNATLGTRPQHALTLVDNDAQPTVKFTAQTQNVGEAAASATVSLQLSAASGKPVTVPLSFGGTASRPGDYDTAVSSLTIPAGDLSGSFSLSIVNDTVFESPNETVIVSAGSPGNATLIDPGSQTVTIVDDDSAPPADRCSTAVPTGGCTVNGVKNQLCRGGPGNDLIVAGNGNSVLIGGGGDDALSGGNGADLLCGGSGNDVLLGNSGNDTLLGGEGTDIVSGGKGTDSCIAEFRSTCER